MSRISIIQQILSQVEFEISDGVGVEYEDTNNYLNCFEPLDENECGSIEFAEKINGKWEKADLTSEELNEILSVLQEVAEQEIAARDQEERESIQYAKDMQDTYRALEYNRYH